MSEPFRPDPLLAGHDADWPPAWRLARVLALVTLFALALGACHPFGGWHRHRHGDDATERTERVERAVDRVFSRVDATDDQKTRIAAIANRAFDTVGPVRPAMAEAGGDLLAVLDSATIDRDRLEQLRRERVERVDRSSRVLATALADIAEVLTPEQRQRLAERARERLDRYKP